MKWRSVCVLIIFLVLMVFIISTAATYLLISVNDETISYPNNSTLHETVLGNNSKGLVTREGPYGDVNSQIKIAYIVGVHPNESRSHQALTKSVEELDKSLNKCYYIYRINVTQDANSYSAGRMNGQLLAQEYIVPDIKGGNFSLVVDVHSNVGNWQETRFLFSPVKGSRSEEIARQITVQLPWIKYYVPPNPTSPSYVTQPLDEAGIPAIIYETFVKDNNEVMKEHATEFVKIIDGLNIN